MLPKQTDALDAAFLIPVAKMAQGQAIEKDCLLYTSDAADEDCLV